MTLRVSLVLCVLLALSVCGSKLSESHATLQHLQSLHKGINFTSFIRGLVMADPGCTGIAPGKPVADPDNCLNYYMCDADEKPIGPIPCEEGMLCFDITTSTCIDKETARKDECLRCKDDPAGGACKTECAGQYDHIAFTDDCSKHAICLEDTGADSKLFEAYCPSDKPYFDGEKCGTDKASCCNCQAPACTTAGELLPDPTDCHGYYACVDLGEADPTAVQLKCEDGGSFVVDKCDPATKECENSCDLEDGGSTPSGDATTSSGDSTTSIGDSTTDSSGATTPASGSTPGDTSSDSSDATSAGPTTTDDGCTDPADFTCTAKGYYAHCTSCDPSYIKCDNAGASPKLGNCSGDLVFNPKPDYPYCIRPENCPFPNY